VHGHHHLPAASCSRRINTRLWAPLGAAFPRLWRTVLFRSKKYAALRRTSLAGAHQFLFPVEPALAGTVGGLLFLGFGAPQFLFPQWCSCTGFLSEPLHQATLCGNQGGTGSIQACWWRWRPGCLLLKIPSAADMHIWLTCCSSVLVTACLGGGCSRAKSATLHVNVGATLPSARRSPVSVPPGKVLLCTVDGGLSRTLHRKAALWAAFRGPAARWRWRPPCSLSSTVARLRASRMPSTGGICVPRRPLIPIPRRGRCTVECIVGNAYVSPRSGNE
jgi:hypothetical protein